MHHCINACTHKVSFPLPFSSKNHNNRAPASLWHPHSIQLIVSGSGMHANGEGDALCMHACTCIILVHGYGQRQCQRQCQCHAFTHPYESSKITRLNHTTQHFLKHHIFFFSHQTGKHTTPTNLSLFVFQTTHSHSADTRTPRPSRNPNETKQQSQPPPKQHNKANE